MTISVTARLPAGLCASWIHAGHIGLAAMACQLWAAIVAWIYVEELSKRHALTLQH